MGSSRHYYYVVPSILLLTFMVVGYQNYSFDTRATLWPNGEVPVQFEVGFSSSTKFQLLSACRKWRAAANVKCRLRNLQKDQSYVFVSAASPDCKVDGHGMNAGGARMLYLNPRCVTSSTLLHELGHIFGLGHEHQRPDAYRYISGNWGSSPDLTSDTPYDFASIMHYVGLQLTDEFINYGETIGGRIISEEDARGLARFYGGPRGFGRISGVAQLNFSPVGELYTIRRDLISGFAMDYQSCNVPLDVKFKFRKMGARFEHTMLASQTVLQAENAPPIRDLGCGRNHTNHGYSFNPSTLGYPHGTYVIGVFAKDPQNNRWTRVNTGHVDL